MAERLFADIHVAEQPRVVPPRPAPPLRQECLLSREGGPKVMNVGSDRPPLSAATNSPTNAPVLPSYSSTALPSSLATKRLPFGPNAMPSASLRPPLPAVTNTPLKAPVVPS